MKYTVYKILHWFNIAKSKIFNEFKGSQTKSISYGLKKPIDKKSKLSKLVEAT
jgi:hypothetical protein